jgi:hypothetical protein
MRNPIVLEHQFSDQQLEHILEQSIVYSCACPAQVCKTLMQERELFAYQAKCLNLTTTDEAVHRAIAESVQATHREKEQCLVKVLELEGWDSKTLTMPEDLQKRMLDEQCDTD